MQNLESEKARNYRYRSLAQLANLGKTSGGDLLTKRINTRWFTRFINNR